MRDIFWSSVLLLWSCWPLVRHSPMIRLQVRLTFSQADLWTDVPPLAETSVGQVCYYFGQVDLWSDVSPGRDIFWPSMLLLWSGWPLVRHTPMIMLEVRLPFSQTYLWSDVPPTIRLKVRLTFSQADLWSVIPSMIRLWVRLTFSQASGQTDLWSDVPPQLGFRSGWHLVRLTFGQMYPHWQRHLLGKCVTTLVRLTSGQMYPLAETSSGQVCYCFGQADLWSDIPPWLCLRSGCHLVRLTFGQMYPPQLGLRSG